MYTEVIRYEQVKRTFTRSNPCPSCGRKVRRQRTFTQTINPFNKTIKGTIKTRRDIWAELGETGAQWETETETCSRCPIATKTANHE